LNALMGKQRALVHADAGTTRDYLEERLEIEGFPVLLTDTAGLRASATGVEAEGMERGRGQMAQADLILLVCDASQGFTSADAEALADLPLGPAHWLLWNKCDLAQPPSDNGQGILAGPSFVVSALSGSGLGELKRAILNLALDGKGSAVLGQALVTQERHVQALRRACGSLEQALVGYQQGAYPETIAADLREALDALGDLLGHTTRREILDEIFSHFCIGK
jgi:tRNA modification GTPase